MIDKQVKTTADAVAGVRDGSTVLVAGFGAVGVADHLLDALHEQGAGELTIVANNSGNGDHGLARLIISGRVRKVICSFPALRRLQRLPQCLPRQEPGAGIAAAGHHQRAHALPRRRARRLLLPGFGRHQIRRGQGSPGDRRPDARAEKPLKGDVALIKANKADRWGNLTYIKSARNFNPVMAMAADLTVVEVDADG